VEWVKGALLTEYERQLSPEKWEEFLSRYTKRLIGTIGDTRPYFYTYRRVLVWGAF
jgi:trans-aconitate 2-methyltransferase